jgi:leucyl-tRNA synthetase
MSSIVSKLLLSNWPDEENEENFEILKKTTCFISKDWIQILEDKNNVLYNEVKEKIKSKIDSFSKEKLKGKASFTADTDILYHKTNFPIEFTEYKSIGGKEVNVLNFDKINNDPNYSSNIYLYDKDFICDTQVEKMSKSKWNVVNPDDVCKDYGADTLRLYEMFLGPLQDAKPWSTQGIEGVLRFLRKFWRMFHNNPEENFVVSDENPSKEELKILHKTIKKATEDIENFSFNTSVSAFMVCVNELQELKCNKRQILEPLTILLAPYAPHIAEELWSLCGHSETITYAQWPEFNPEHLIENEFNYPISFNGKVRFNLNFPLDMDAKELENQVLKNEQTIKYLDGKSVKKFILVKGRIVNVVV